MQYTLNAPDLPQDQREQLERIATQSGYPLDAVLLVVRALTAVCRGLPPEFSDDSESTVTHVPAVAVCAAVCDHARHLFGESAFDALFFWRLRRGENVGAIVYALIEQGLGRASESDSIDDFNSISLAQLLNPEVA